MKQYTIPKMYPPRSLSQMDGAVSINKVYKTLYMYRIFNDALDGNDSTDIYNLISLWKDVTKVGAFTSGIRRLENERNQITLSIREVYSLGSTISPENKSLTVLELLGYQSAAGYMDYISNRGHTDNANNPEKSNKGYSQTWTGMRYAVQSTGW